MTRFDISVPDWGSMTPLSIVGSAEIDDSGLVHFPTTEGQLTISHTEFGVRLQTGEEPGYDYGMLVEEPAILPVEVLAGSEETTIKSEHYSLVIQHIPFRFAFYSGDRLIRRSSYDGHFVRRFRLPPMTRVDGGWFINFELLSSEPVYGLGEKWSKLDRRGQLIQSYNHDALGVNAEISYKNTPFAWSPKGWGSLVHTAGCVTHGVGYAPWSHRSYGIYVEDKRFDLFLFAHDSPAQVLRDYTALTGRAPRVPDWSLGVILSKAYYQDSTELLAVAREVRQRKMPCDVITLDGRAWQDTETRFAFEWDRSRHEDPAGTMKELKAMDFKVCAWEYPLISIKNPLFAKLAEKGWLIRDRRTGEAFIYHWDDQAFGNVLTPLPESGILDFTHPEAYEFWCQSHKPLFDIGIDMIKADFGEQLESDFMVAANGATGYELHNAYALLYNRCVYEAASRYSKTGAFLFSRSSWTGCQRYPSQWGGDPQADWAGMAASFRGGLSWGMSGAPFYATDVGGFFKDFRNAELYVRWLQAAVFSAHIRLHGIGERTPWSYGGEAAEAATQALRLRYQLLPYIHKTVHQACETGLPVQRAMVLAFPEDIVAWSFEDQFMFGDDMLVVPCFEPGGEIEFYLPEGKWLMFPSQRPLEGGRVHRMQMPLNEIAVFVKEGTSIPMGADVEHTEAIESMDAVEYHWP